MNKPTFKQKSNAPALVTPPPSPVFKTSVVRPVTKIVAIAPDRKVKTNS